VKVGSDQNPLHLIHRHFIIPPIIKRRRAWQLVLLTELNPDIDLAFGLCILGLGEPELGYVSLQELSAARGPLGLPLECDLHFAPTRTIAAYAVSSVPHKSLELRFHRPPRPLDLAISWCRRLRLVILIQRIFKRRGERAHHLALLQPGTHSQPGHELNRK
jgi:hypothetical protein